MFITVLVCVIAGLGAGVGTGLAGLSAAAVISPMLIVFLHVDPYMAVGIALASDVLASAISAVVYGVKKNIDIKNGLVMMAAVLVFTFLGSWVGSLIPSGVLGNFSVFMTALVGIKFIVRPVNATENKILSKPLHTRVWQSIVCGSLIGMVCGVVGAGGGMMLLLILTSVLGYELKTAVGTSVFIMAFTALTGAVSHFAIGALPDPLILIICIVATVVGAQVAAVFANKANTKILNRVTGIVLTAIGVAMIVVNFVNMCTAAA